MKKRETVVVFMQLTRDYIIHSLFVLVNNEPNDQLGEGILNQLKL